MIRKFPPAELSKQTHADLYLHQDEMSLQGLYFQCSVWTCVLTGMDSINSLCVGPYLNRASVLGNATQLLQVVCAVHWLVLVSSVGAEGLP